MVNDITTLNGSLSQLGETLASNITSKGVSASASDGLTTLANKVLQITGGGGSTTLFEDDCSSASGLSQYGSSECVRGSTATMSMSYDSSENAYAVSGSGNWHAYIPIPALNDKDEYTISMEVKGQSYNFNNIGLFLDNRNDTTSYGLCASISVNSNEFYIRQYRLSSDGTSYINGVSLSGNTWYRIEYTVNGSSLNAKLYNMSDTLLASQDVTLDVSNKSMGIFMFCEAGTTNSKGWVRNIKAESLGGGSDCTQYQTQIADAITYINGSGS